MATRYLRDRKGLIQKVADRIIRKSFPALQHTKILYIWRTPPRREDSRILAGRARVLPVRDRDLYGYDFEIEISLESWKNLNKAGKKRLMWHELRHCQVSLDEGNKVERDREGRAFCYIEDHDIDIRSFKEEYSMFGLPKGDIEQIESVYNIWKNRRQYGRIERSTMEIDGEETEIFND